MSSGNSEKKTDFGYQEVPWSEKQQRVADVFHSVASRYDVMNDLMSLGIHRLWKHITINMSATRKGHTILDIAGGTGDLTARFSRLAGERGKVILADINDSMLKVGRDRLIDKGLNNVDYVQANAECLPFKKDTFDCVTIAFGLRNVTDKAAALKSMFRVLKPGGKLLILEFSRVKNPIVKKLYDTYSFSVLPVLGKFVAKDEKSYRYLAESIRMHPDQQTLERMMRDAGFTKTSWHNLTAGVVALHQGIKS